MTTWSDEENKRMKQLLNKTSGRNNVSKLEMKEVDYLIKKKQCYFSDSDILEKYKPYSAEDYLNAKAFNLDLDNWNDYQEFFNLGK